MNNAPGAGYLRDAADSVNKQVYYTPARPYRITMQQSRIPTYVNRVQSQGLLMVAECLELQDPTANHRADCWARNVGTRGSE